MMNNYSPSILHHHNTDNISIRNNEWNHQLYPKIDFVNGHYYHHLHNKMVLQNDKILLSGKERSAIFLSNFIPLGGSSIFINLLPGLRSIVSYSATNDIIIFNDNGSNVINGNSEIKLNLSLPDLINVQDMNLSGRNEHLVENLKQLKNEKFSQANNDDNDLIDEDNYDSIRLNPTKFKSACNPCARSKIRCVRYDNNEKCERCLHIGYHCVFSRKKERREV